MKQLISHIALCLITLLSLTACNNEDNLDELFIGKTWYMTGATINGQTMNSDVSRFYADGTNDYYISFATNKFTGVMTTGKTFSGSWGADGKKQTIALQIDAIPSGLSIFDANLFSIIRNISSYEGDANVMLLKKDNDNYIRFAAKR